MNDNKNKTYKYSRDLFCAQCEYFTKLVTSHSHSHVIMRHSEIKKNLFQFHSPKLSSLCCTCVRVQVFMQVLNS